MKSIDNKSLDLKSLIGNLVWVFLWIILFALILLKLLVFQNVTVVGKSMMPNYQDGQLLLVNQLSKNFDRGDVVAVYKDDDVAKDADYFTRFNTIFFLKRVIALPGESIEIVGGNIIIYNNNYKDGVSLKENYIPESIIESENNRQYYYPKTKISVNSYFVMGDNRSNSLDSRSSLGPVKDYAMFGKEFIRFWPIEECEVFKKPVYTFMPISSDIKEKLEIFRSNYNSTSSQ